MQIRYEWLIIFILLPITLFLGYNYFFRSRENIITDYQIREQKIEHIYDLKNELKINQEKFQKQIDSNENIIKNKINKINYEKHKLDFLEESIRNNDTISPDSCLQIWKSIKL